MANQKTTIIAQLVSALSSGTWQPAAMAAVSTSETRGVHLSLELLTASLRVGATVVTAAVGGGGGDVYFGNYRRGRGERKCIRGGDHGGP